jgi:two-component system sensor histidine kinase CiaH
MIAKLRKKFILIAMGSLVLVLAVLMGAINVVNYVKLDRSSDAVLAVLAENGGEFPEFERGDMTPPSGAEQPDSSETPEQPDSSEAPEKPDGVDSLRRGSIFSEETPYETRFFSVQLTKAGELSSVNTGKIAAVSTEDAVAMAQTLYKSGKTSGYSGNYKYLATASDSGTLYVFLDCTRDLSSFRNFLTVSLLASAAGILAVFVLVLVLSRRAILPVAESYEKQKQFITNAGHEIKTPLAIIDSCTEVIEMEQGESKWTTGIRGQVARLTELTKQLVSLARMDEGLKLTMEDFDLTEAVRDTLAPFALLAGNAGLQLASELQEGVTLRGNEQTVRQLVSILADNAVKYAAPGSEIRFTLSRRGKKAVLTSENAAEGLQAGSQNQLFDRFYRGDASHSSEKSGYGIGLSMAQSIAAAHGGKIEAKSPDGKSLVITVQL